MYLNKHFALAITETTKPLPHFLKNFFIRFHDIINLSEQRLVITNIFLSCLEMINLIGSNGLECAKQKNIIVGDFDNSYFFSFASGGYFGGIVFFYLIFYQLKLNYKILPLTVFLILSISYTIILLGDNYLLRGYIVFPYLMYLLKEDLKLN